MYPAIICQFSRMAVNCHEVEQFRTYWRERGAEVKVRSMLEWTATGSVRSDVIDHSTEFRIACPWANNTMAVHENGNVVACAVDYEGSFVIGSARERTLKELWQALGYQLRKLHHEHRWDELPAVCRRCADWQAVGAEYEPEELQGTRPFWFPTLARDVAGARG